MFKDREAPKGTLAHDGDMLHFAWLRLLVSLRKSRHELVVYYALLMIPIIGGAYILESL